ncbi:TIGR04372 family glycosyltransferase [Candidatus Pelagibacter sp.]|nr:TIGR04372 family glycosyltransferase [Candidatus Pelagibacter sp.]
MNKNRFINLFKTISLFIKQFKDIKKYNSDKIFKKIIIIFIYLLELLLIISLIPFVFIIRLIKPLIWIRFGPIRSDVIGHFVNDVGYYLAEKSSEEIKKIDFLYLEDNGSNYSKFGNRSPNSTWYKLAKRRMYINSIAKYFERSSNLIYNSKIHFVRVGSGLGSHDPEGILQKFKCNIKFNTYEDKSGYDFLKKIGLKSTDQFICFNVRDPAYKNKYHDFHNWDYTTHKNSNIDSYAEAAMTLAEKGYWVFRMGKGAEKNFKSKHPNIIDYAKSSIRNDFLDIWLNANCYFSVCTPSGMAEVSKVFYRPVLFTNFIPICDMQYSKETFILPKKLKRKSNNTFLSLKEIIENGMIEYQKKKDYDDNNIEIVDNSAEEINEAVLEMESKLKNKWVKNILDNEMQNAFHENFKTWTNYKKYFVGAKNPILATSFLRKNYKWFLSEK